MKLDVYPYKQTNFLLPSSCRAFYQLMTRRYILRHSGEEQYFQKKQQHYFHSYNFQQQRPICTSTIYEAIVNIWEASCYEPSIDLEA